MDSKEFDKEIPVATKKMDGLAASAARFLAIIGGSYAIKIFAEDLITASAAMDRLAKNLGIGAAGITAWGNAVEEVGGSAKGLQGSLMMLSREQTNLLLTGESSLIPYFSMLGISLATAAGKARPTTEILMDLATATERMARPQAHNVLAAMGLDEGTINLLVLGRHEVELALKRQKEYGEQLAKFAPEATKLQRSLVDLKQQFILLGLGLLQSAAPALERFLGLLQSAAAWVSANRENVLDFLKGFAVALGVVALVAVPIDLTVVAIVALAAAIGLLWNDYKVWKEGGKSLINWGQWKGEIDAAKAGLQELARIGKASFGAIYLSAQGVSKAAHGDWAGAKALFDQSDDMVRSLIMGTSDNPTALGQFLTNSIRGDYAHSKAAGAIAHIEGYDKSGSRAQRDNNPGDLEYKDFAKSHGATGSDGRFAIFPDASSGFKALDALLTSKSYSGLTTSQAISKYAPSNENNTARYLQQFNAATNSKPGDTMAQVMSGTTVTTGDITINTQATDANGVALGFKNGLNWLFTSQANSGLN